jgi:hypothetical protein
MSSELSSALMQTIRKFNEISSGSLAGL